MKIYVSEEDIKENDLLDTESYDFVLTKYREDFWEEEVYPEIQSLEAHEEEIRKPLEDEIERFKKDNKQLKQRIDELETLQPKFNLGEYFYYIERGIVRSKKLSDYSVRTLLSGEIAIFYWLRYDEYIIEEDMFKTEEEALAELERRNKN